MIKDYHGWSVDAVLQDIDVIVGQVRHYNASEMYEFITGHGVIRPALISHLSNYKLSPTIKLGNTGVVVVVVE